MKTINEIPNYNKECPIGSLIHGAEECVDKIIVVDALLEEYEVELDCCKYDLLALPQELAAEGLIEAKDEMAAKIIMSSLDRPTPFGQVDVSARGDQGGDCGCFRFRPCSAFWWE